jgi:hypothetical protein
MRGNKHISPVTSESGGVMINPRSFFTSKSSCVANCLLFDGGVPLYEAGFGVVVVVLDRLDVVAASTSFFTGVLELILIIKVLALMQVIDLLKTLIVLSKMDSALPAIENSQLSMTTTPGTGKSALGVLKAFANPLVIHVALELIVIGGISFYFFKKTRELNSEVTELKKRVTELENALIEQSKNMQYLHKLIMASKAASNKSPPVQATATGKSPVHNTTQSTRPLSSSGNNSSNGGSTSSSQFATATTPKRSPTPTSSGNATQKESQSDSSKLSTGDPKMGAPATPSKSKVQAITPQMIKGDSDSEESVDEDELDSVLQSEYENMETARSPIKSPRILECDDDSDTCNLVEM